MSEPKQHQLATQAVHAGQSPDPTTGARAVPIYQTTSYLFQDADHAGRLFALKEFGNIYTRIMNPTTDVLEKRVAALEGGAAGLATASGQAAETLAITTLAAAGDEIVSTTSLYGGTYNLFHYTLPKLGINVKFVDGDDFDGLRAAINSKTRAVYTETLGNPKLDVADIETLASIAHEHKLPFIIDNTCASPALTRPIEWGADIVVNSATKFLGGHADALGGVVCGSKRLVGRVHHHREITGAALDPMAAYLLLRGMKTLHLRIRQQNESALKIARFLEAQPQVSRVFYPGLASHPEHDVARRQMRGFGGVLSFGLEGGFDAVRRVLPRLRLVHRAARLIDAGFRLLQLRLRVVDINLRYRVLIEQRLHAIQIALRIGEPRLRIRERALRASERGLVRRGIDAIEHCSRRNVGTFRVWSCDDHTRDLRANLHRLGRLGLPHVVELCLDRLGLDREHGDIRRRIRGRCGLLAGGEDHAGNECCAGKMEGHRFHV